MQSGETRGREVSEETPGPVQASVRGGKEVRAEGRAGRTLERGPAAGLRPSSPGRPRQEGA